MSYTFEQRKRAVKPYVKYSKSVAAVRRELGHPSRQPLHDWHADYVEHGFRPDCRLHGKFTAEQKQAAV